MRGEARFYFAVSGSMGLLLIFILALEARDPWCGFIAFLNIACAAFWLDRR
jgi:hypothetical protein